MYVCGNLKNWSLYPHTLMYCHGTWTQWSLGRVTHVTSTDMGQRSSRGQWPLVQVFGKKGQCIHIYFDVFSNLILQWLQKYVIAKAGETRGSRTALFLFFSLSPKDPYFGSLVRTSPSLSYVSAPPRDFRPLLELFNILHAQYLLSPCYCLCSFKMFSCFTA